MLVQTDKQVVRQTHTHTHSHTHTPNTGLSQWRALFAGLCKTTVLQELLLVITDRSMSN